MPTKRYRPALIAGAALAAMLSVASPAVAVSGPGLGTIVGHVTGPAGGPVSHVSVAAVNAATGFQTGVTALTRFDGSYELDNIPPGGYKLRVSIPSQTQWAHQKLTFSDADTFEIAADQTTTIDEAMLGPGKIELSATDAVTGEPVGEICASTVPGGRACITDPGTLTLSGLPTGTYRIDVTSTDGLHAPAQIGGVHVNLGQTTPVSVSLTPTGAISVTVDDSATGEPIGGACVAALRPGFNGVGPQGCETRTNGTGRAVVGALPAGTFNLFVAPNDGIHGLQWVGWRGGTGDQSAAVPLGVTLGKLTVAPTVQADPVGTITGTITDATTGQPIANGLACASVLPTGVPQGVFGGTICTDDQGQYNITGVGPYRWPVQYTFHSANPAWQWAGGTANRFDSHRVKVAAGKATTADFKAVPGGTLTLSLFNADGSPFRDTVTVHAFNAVTGDIAALGIGDLADGTYTIMGLTSQDIKVQVDGLDSAGNHVGLTFAASPSIPVRVGATATYDIVLTPLA